MIRFVSGSLALTLLAFPATSLFAQNGSKSPTIQNKAAPGTSKSNSAQGKKPTSSTPVVQTAPVDTGKPLDNDRPVTPTATPTSVAAKEDSDANRKDGKHLLRYKLVPGQVITSEVTHLAKTDTKIEKNEQSSQSRTVSQKVWQVDKVDASGNMVFIYRIEGVDMSQQIGDQPEIKYSSKSGEEAPSIFGKVADSIGKPLSTVTINPRGEVVHREEGKATPSMGMGDIALIMPEGPIAIGEEWSAPREVRVRTPDGGQKTIKIREVHQLEKVSAGIATISIRSEPLTPIHEPEVEAQVVQQLSNGTIRFDIDKGRMVSKELKWNERVVGFSGSGSLMEYTARYMEEVKSVVMQKGEGKTATASRPANSAKTAEKR